MTLDSHGDLHRGDVPPADGTPRRSGSTTWTEPLTDGERQIIENVLVTADLTTTRRWLRFCLRVLEAQTGR